MNLQTALEQSFKSGARITCAKLNGKWLQVDQTGKVNSNIVLNDYECLMLCLSCQDDWEDEVTYRNRTQTSLASTNEVRKKASQWISDNLTSTKKGLTP